MQSLYDFVASADYCTSLALIAILTCLGHHLAQSWPDGYVWGPRSAVGAFLLYAAYGLGQDEPITVEGLLFLTLRALLAAGLVLGPAWIVLALAGFLQTQLVEPFRHQLQRCADVARQRRATSRDRQQHDRDRRRHEEALHAQHHETPEQAQARRSAAERARQEQQAQRRRQEARLGCELFFALHEAVLDKTFKRDLFQQYLDRYLSDAEPPELVEERARLFVTQLQQAVAKIDPSPKFRSLPEIDAWYQQQRQPIEAIADAALRETLLAKLDARREDLTTRFLEEMHA